MSVCWIETAISSRRMNVQLKERCSFGLYHCFTWGSLNILTSTIDSARQPHTTRMTFPFNKENFGCTPVRTLNDDHHPLLVHSKILNDYDER